MGYFAARFLTRINAAVPNDKTKLEELKSAYEGAKAPGGSLSSLVSATVDLCNAYHELREIEQAVRLEKEVLDLFGNRPKQSKFSDFQGLFLLWTYTCPDSSISVPRLKELLSTLIAVDGAREPDFSWRRELNKLIDRHAEIQDQTSLFEYWLELIPDVSPAESIYKRHILERLLSCVERSETFERAKSLYQQLFDCVPLRSPDRCVYRFRYATFCVKQNFVEESIKVWRDTCNEFDWNFPDVVYLHGLLTAYDFHKLEKCKADLVDALLANPSANVLRMLDGAVRLRVMDLLNNSSIESAEHLLRLRVSASELVDNFDPGNLWKLWLSEVCYMTGKRDESEELFGQVTKSRTLLREDTADLFEQRKRFLERVSENEQRKQVCIEEAQERNLKEFQERLSARVREAHEQSAKFISMNNEAQSEIAKAVSSFESTRTELEQLKARHESELQSAKDELLRIQAETESVKRGIVTVSAEKLNASDEKENLTEQVNSLRDYVNRNPISIRNEIAAGSMPPNVVLPDLDHVPTRTRLDFAILAHTRIDLSGDVLIASVSVEESPIRPTARGCFGNIYCPGHIRLEGTVSVAGTIYGVLVGRLSTAEQTRIRSIPKPATMPDVGVPFGTLELSKPLSAASGEFQTSYLEMSRVGLKFRAGETLRIYLRDEIDSGDVVATLLNANHGGDPRSLEIFYNGDRQIVMPHNSKVCATIYAPNAEIVMPKGNHTFAGAIVANTVTGEGVITLAYYELLQTVEYIWQ